MLYEQERWWGGGGIHNSASADGAPLGRALASPRFESNLRRRNEKAGMPRQRRTASEAEVVGELWHMVGCFFLSSDYPESHYITSCLMSTTTGVAKTP